MSKRKRVDRFDAAAVALLTALVQFLGEYRTADESARRSALALVRGGLEELREGVPKQTELGGGGLKDGGDAG